MVPVETACPSPLLLHRPCSLFLVLATTIAVESRDFLEAHLPFDRIASIVCARFNESSQVMTHEGEAVRGPEAILAKLKAMAQMNSTFGRAVYEAEKIDAQALGAVC